MLAFRSLQCGCATPFKCFQKWGSKSRVAHGCICVTSHEQHPAPSLTEHAGGMRTNCCTNVMICCPIQFVRPLQYATFCLVNDCWRLLNLWRRPMQQPETHRKEICVGWNGNVTLLHYYYSLISYNYYQLVHNCIYCNHQNLIKNIRGSMARS